MSEIKVLSLEEIVSKMDIQTAHRFVNDYSTSLIGRKVRIKTRVSYRRTPATTGIVKKTEADKHRGGRGGPRRLARGRPCGQQRGTASNRETGGPRSAWCFGKPLVPLLLRMPDDGTTLLLTPGVRGKPRVQQSWCPAARLGPTGRVEPTRGRGPRACSRRTALAPSPHARHTSSEPPVLWLTGYQSEAPRALLGPECSAREPRGTGD